MRVSAFARRGAAAYGDAYWLPKRAKMHGFMPFPPLYNNTPRTKKMRFLEKIIVPSFV